MTAKPVTVAQVRLPAAAARDPMLRAAEFRALAEAVGDGIVCECRQSQHATRVS